MFCSWEGGGPLHPLIYTTLALYLSKKKWKIKMQDCLQFSFMSLFARDPGVLVGSGSGFWNEVECCFFSIQFMFTSLYATLALYLESFIKKEDLKCTIVYNFLWYHCLLKLQTFSLVISVPALIVTFLYYFLNSAASSIVNFVPMSLYLKVANAERLSPLIKFSITYIKIRHHI